MVARLCAVGQWKFWESFVYWHMHTTQSAKMSRYNESRREQSVLDARVPVV